MKFLKNYWIVITLLITAILSIFTIIYRHKAELILSMNSNSKDILDILILAPVLIVTFFFITNTFSNLAKYVEEGTTSKKKRSFGNDFIKKIIAQDISFDFTPPPTVDEKKQESLLNDEQKQIRLIEEHTINLQQGISLQIEKISRSGTINLLIGLALTILAIALLIGIVFSEEPAYLFDETTNSGVRFFIHMIPRLSIVLFIEIFSFFFLNLYKRNHEEIKYFNNERTNIESKILALKTAILFGNEDSINKTIESLYKVERNFIIKKTDSTIDLEKLKLEKNDNENIIGKVLQLANLFNKGN